jgi:hypothetical protein
MLVKYFYCFTLNYKFLFCSLIETAVVNSRPSNLVSTWI